MSSTFVADTTDDCKTDNTLIIIVNNDGTISVDQETLQNLLANQQNAPVSVVRVGAASQGDDNSQDSNGTCDSQNDGNPHVNLTVEGFYPQVTPQAAGAEGALPSVGETPLDPFLEMDPEQLERLETALQSEQAKQILGENVTAMLDMLSVEEEASKLKDTIRMDHCYTNLSPSSAPSVVPSSNTVISNQNDGDTASSNDEEQVKVTSSSGRGSVRGTRGRGRGPGRPRKDGSISRPTTSYRGGAGRGGVRGQSTRGGTANHVLMQQMQHITPPPNAPSATLVPLIKPLVLPSNASSTVTLSSGQAFAHKQILPVQSGAGGARFVTLAAKPSGQNVSSGQQRILVTNNSTVQLQALKIPISQSAGQVTTSSASSSNSGSQSPQVTSSTLTSGVGQAKVLVAKMPSIPPQLLGAQPTTANVDGGKIISKNNLSEDDTEFSKFSQDEESEETDEADTDDEDFMIMSNKRNVGRGGRPRPRGGRRTRFRGTGRGWLRGRVVRGFLKQRGLGRGGRGSGRSEDLSQVHKLDSEMASALIAMSRSPEPEEPMREASEKGSPTKSSEGDKDRDDANTSFSPDVVGKKKLKIALKISSKRKSEVGGVEVPNQEIPTEKKEDNTVTVVSKDEKVNIVKVSPIKPGEDVQAKQAAVTEQKPDSRKNYPKRENRKPPAHLAEALGPALFSTPDIIRRVSTGSENKSVLHSPVDSKDETGMVVKSESLSQDIILSSTSDKVNETTELPSPVSKKKVDDVPIKDEIAPEKTEKVDGKSNLNTIQPEEVKNEIKSEPLLMESSPINSHKTESGGAVRPNRKRNIQIRLDGLLKKDPSLKHQSQGKDKKSRNVKTKGRGRRRSPDLKVEESDEEDDQSSDDESWNSEDDPDRLWCICKKPHNNRFMICCDSCEDWFHGKCVGITKAMGKQMENKGLEWTCPNCSEKKQAEEKVKDVKRKVFKEKDVKKYSREAVKDKEETSDSHSRGSSDNKKDVSEEQTNQVSRSSLNEAGMFCIVCKKAARTSSIYCSDECILKHAKESLSEKGVQSANKLNQTIAVKTAEPNSSQLPKARLDARVMVFERKTGKLLSGPNAPTVSNLKSWLKDNPTFEIVRPGDANTGKILTSKQSLMSKYMESKDDGSAAAVPGQPKLSSSQQSKKGILVQQKISQLLQKPPQPQTKLLTNVQLQTNENSQPKLAAPSKPPASPLKGAAPQKGVIVLGKPAQPGIASPKSVSAKGLKQTILIPVETVHKIGIRTYSKSPGGNSKSTPKSPVLTSPTKSQNVAPKSTPPQVVSKVPATSTVKDPEKVIVRKIEMKRTSVEPNKKEKEEEKEKEKPPGPEPIRLNVRKTLQELLQMRIQECDDLVVPEEDIQTIALHIEEEMHSYFRDTGIKYKSKYRSLVFNIKDPKNLTLFRKIADKSVTPYQLVRLSPEELASQELAQWRERETKHQIEWIKKNELDMLSLSKTYVMKTHKGEQVIETDDSLKAEVPDLVDPAAETEVRNLSNNSVTSTVEDGKLSSKKDKSKPKEKSKDSKNKNKKEEKEKSHEKDKSKSLEKRNKEKSEKGKKDDESNKREHRHHRGDGDHERHRSSRRERRGSESKSHDHEKRKDYKSESSHREKKEDGEKEGREVGGDIELTIEESNETKGEAQSTTDIKETVKDEDATMSFSVPSGTQIDLLEDTDPSDREPTSTVSIKTPDINVDETDANVVTVWKGFVNMPDVAKFFTSVQVVSGDSQNLSKDLPESVDIVGRIMPNTVWDYISKMKKTGTKEILVIRLIAANDEEKIPYITLYTYLNSRNRLGVVGNCSKMIKDFYIMPLPSYEQVPQVLLPLRGPGFEDYRPHLLLGIIVRSKRKRLAPENEYIAKVPKRTSSDGPTEVGERSYTPPLPNADADNTGSLTPPHPHPSTSDSYTPPLSPTQSFYSVSQHHDARRKWVERRDSEKSSIDDLSPVEKHGATSDAVAKHKSSFSDDEDADAPYSPGGSDDDDDVGDSSEDNLLSTPKSSSELERKMEELNRKIEEQKQQIQCISSAIVGSDTTVSSGSIQMKSVMQSYMMTSSRKSEDPDESEAYSPSRSFTPPPSTPSVLTSLTSNISIPSNLQEILASIKKQETVISTGSSKGINLKTDPIVQNYGSAQPEAESIPISDSHYSSSTYTVRKSETVSALSQTQLQSASSALLSLSTPVIHSLHSSDSKSNRDPRQRGSLTPETASKVAGSTLSTLSDDDLIKKAAEMMEMEKLDASDKAASSGKLFHSSGVESGIHSLAGKVHPALQPLPPGVEDDYSSYSGPYPSSQQPLSPSKHGVTILPSGAIKYPTPHGAVVSYPVAHHYKPPPPPPPSTPPPPPPPPPPPSAYNLPHGSSKELGYSSSYQPQTQAGYVESRKLLPRKKRKYDDGPGGSDMKRDRGKSPGPGGREIWDSKMPPHMRGRYGMRGGRGYMRGNRGYMRQRGGRTSEHNQMRWDGQADKHFNRRKSPRYDAGIRSEWDMHIKDFEEKHRERSRQLRHNRDRDRRDRSSGSSQRSSRSGSRRNRDSNSP